MSEYKIGDIVTADKEVCTFEKAEVVAFHGNGNVILEVKSLKGSYWKYGLGDLVAKSADVLDAYYKKSGSAKFFEGGHVYKFRDLETTYEIVEIHSVESRGEEKLFALAVYTTTGDVKGMKVLDEYNFSKMVKAVLW